MRVYMYVFRGKCILSGEWVYGDLVTDIEDVAIATDVRITDPFGAYLKRSKQVEMDTVGQYTGLKDKNGKDIYEGDIVQVEEEVVVVGKKTNVKVNKVVKYKEEYGQFLLYQGDKGEHLTFASSGEVVGNIYENNDLLEGKE